MRRLVPFALALALLPNLAPAQTGRHLPALETFVAVADRAFTGRILKVDRTTFRNASEGPDHREYQLPNSLLYRYTLTIQVERNVRGRGDDTVRLRYESQNAETLAGTWMDRKKSYLWSLIPTDRASQGPLHYSMIENTLEDGSGGWLLLDLDTLKDGEDAGRYGRFHLPLFSENLGVVRSREEAIARLEAFSRAHPKPLPLITATVPWEFAVRNGISPNAYLVVTFPKDPVSEAAIRRQGGEIKPSS